MAPGLTPSQTIGPFYWGTIIKSYHADLAPPGVAGERIEVALTLHDANGAVVPDGLFEIWQANSHGRYAHPEDTGTAPLENAWTGFGRIATDENGRFRFTTVKPGRVAAPGGGLQAPHINVTIFMRGMLRQLVTRIYFPADPANDEDPVLQSVPESRRATLVANADANALTWNVRLQGEGETVFFEY